MNLTSGLLKSSSFSLLLCNTPSCTLKTASYPVSVPTALLAAHCHMVKSQLLFGGNDLGEIDLSAFSPHDVKKALEFFEKSPDSIYLEDIPSMFQIAGFLQAPALPFAHISIKNLRSIRLPHHCQNPVDSSFIYPDPGS